MRRIIRPPLIVNHAEREIIRRTEMNGDASATWLSVALLMAFWCSALGWGRAVNRVFPTRLLRLNSICTVVGLALLNVVGGWLNVVKWASAPGLMIVLAAGVLFLAFDLARVFHRNARLRPPQGGDESKSPAAALRKRFASSRPVSSFAPLLVGTGIGIFTISLLVPTFVFNFQDDFQTYIPRALRIAQTGTLGGSPFDTVGFDSLGAQSFFHALFLPHIDVRMLHMFDTVGCFILAMLLVGEVSVVWRIPALAGALAVFTVAAINPQSVNISPLYSGTVAAATLMLVGAVAVVRLASENARGRHHHEVILGLVTALLTALKLTLAFFAAIYLAVLYLSLLLIARRRNAVIKSAGVTCLAFALGVAPWLVVHVPTIFEARKLAEPFTVEAVLTTKYGSLASHGIPDLWSVRSLFWGDSLGTYHFVVFSCLAAAIVAAAIWRQKRNQPRAYGLLSIVAAGVAILGCYLLNAHLFEVDDAIRYTIPLLIAATPLGWLCLLKFSGINGTKVGRPLTIAVACTMFIVVAVFGKSLAKRVLIAAGSRTTLPFPLNERYLGYCERATSSMARQQTHAFQQKMEPGATVLMSAGAPFQFDFSRNRILTVAEAGLISPVIHFPAGINPEALRQYLRGYGVRYVFFQRDGEGIKTIDILRPELKSENVIYRKLADYGIYYRESMSSLAAQSEILFENDRILLFDLTKPKR